MTSTRSNAARYDAAMRRRAAALAAVLLAVVAPAGIAAADEAAAAFKARCTECHGPRDIQQWGRQHPDVAAREAWLDRFLRRHYPPPDAERALIIRHILSRLSESGR